MKNVNLQLELENRLLNWAAWAIAFSNNQIGYPAKAAIADFGLPSTGVSVSKPPYPLNNLLADEMNAWINMLGKIKTECKIAICAFYLRKSGMKIWQIAKAIGITQTAFNRHLHDARTWLMGRLSVSYENF